MSNGGNNNFEINPQVINIEVSEFRGRSAYQLWLDAGNTGSLEDFFLTIGRVDSETSASLVDTFETRGREILSGSVTNYIPLIVSESSQIQINSASGFSSFSSSVDSRLLNVEEFSSSLDATFATDAEVSASQQSTLNYVNTFTQSYYIDSSSIDSRLDLLESQSGSSQTSFNEYTSSTDLRLQSLETESGSIRLEFNSFTSSQNIINGDVNDDLNTLFDSTNALSAATSSYETKGGGIVSGSSQLTSSYDERYILSGSIAQTTWENIDGKPSGLISSSQQIENDISGAFTSVSESIYTNIVDIDNRLDNLELESGSIRLSFNSYTSSNDSLNTTQNNRLNSLETESGSVNNRLSNIENFTSSQNTLNQTFATTGSNTFNGNQIINGDLFVDADTLVLTGSLLIDGQIETTGITGSLLGTASTASYVDYFSIDNLPTLVSGSSQLTSSYDERYILSGTLSSTTDWENINNIPSGLVSASSQIQLNEITGTTFSSSNFTFPQNLTVQGRLTAQEFYTELVSSSIIYESGSTKFGDTGDDTHQFTGSVLINGNLETNGGLTGSLLGTATTASYVSYTNIDGLPTLVSGSSQLTSSYDERYILSGSITAADWNTLLNIPFGIVSSSQQIASDISGAFTSVSQSISSDIVNIDNRLDLLETESGSIRTTLNSYTQSADLRLQSLETESGSVKSRLTNIESFTSSQSSLNGTFATTGSNVFEGTQTINGELFVDADTIEFTGSFSVYGGITGSLQGTADTASYVDYSNIDNLPTLVSGSSQLTSSYDDRYELKGSSIVSSSSQIQLESVSGFTTYSQSVDDILGGIEQYTSSTDLRLQSIETESGSIHSTFNSYTSSTDNRLNGLETESGSVKNRLETIESFTSSYATTGSNIFSGNQTINGDLIIDGDLTAKNFYIDSASVIYTSGSTKFGDTIDDIHEFTGSVKITGSLELNGLPIGTGKLDEVVFNSYTQSNDLRLQSLETESGSIRTEFNSFTSSYSTDSSSFDTRINNITLVSSSFATTGSNTFVGNQTISGSVEISGSVGVYGNITAVQKTISVLGFPTEQPAFYSEGDVLISGSLILYVEDFDQSFDVAEQFGNAFSSISYTQTVLEELTSSFTEYTSSTDLRIQSLETESGSIRSTFNSYTQSTDSRLDTIESVSGSWVSSDITSSTLITASVFENVITFTKGDNTTFDITVQASGSVIPGLISGSDQLTSSYDNRYELQGSGILSGSYSFNDLTDLPTLISGSSQLTSSYDERYILSGSITAADWNTLLNIPSGIVSSSSQIDLTQTTNYTEFSSSINDTFSSQSIRLDGIDTFTSSIDGRVDNIELTTASFDLRLNSLETESGSIRTELNNYTQSTDGRLNQLETESGSVIGRLSNIESFTSSIDTIIKTKLDVEGVVSSSSQIQIESVSGFTTYSSSVDLRLGFLETESGSIRLEFNQFTSSYNTGSFSGSFVGDLTGNADTATTAQTSVSASYALTASYIDGGFY